MEQRLLKVFYLFAIGTITALGGCASQDPIASRSATDWRTDRASATSLMQEPFPGENQPMAEAEIIMPPSGYLDYCLRMPSECPNVTRRADFREPLTHQRWTELTRVNTQVNSSVRYITDAALYELSEFWTYPDGRGDCEDYVLAKKKRLIELGWAPESLLIGVALDLNKLRHAVLIASTDHGDFVLDNQLSRVVAWADTGYTWEKRQTAANANIWVALTGESAPIQPFEAVPAQPITVADASVIQPTPRTITDTAPEVIEDTLIVSSIAPEMVSPTQRLPMARPAQPTIVAHDDETAPILPSGTAAGA